MSRRNSCTFSNSLGDVIEEPYIGLVAAFYYQLAGHWYVCQQISNITERQTCQVVQLCKGTVWSSMSALTNLLNSHVLMTENKATLVCVEVTVVFCLRACHPQQHWQSMLLYRTFYI